ncbi:LysE family translocator [Pseudoalteromonas sp. HF66]|uniref:LysE family translocator n=1 Tax=Pseudoalteromonas sp. HF66 TaxID=2721559 RepID=UPI001431A742|nr:LysE family transporter [Pseudoalteromonas sp. HF66]NIZ04251.1 LysE family transporter [Pseudoalteromonas sp. HF66]QWV06681.1 LysE family translocator [Pseudoalteromonas shioyasakiensis]
MDISLISIFISVAAAHFLALLSPGPDFVLVVKSALKGNQKNAIGVALGIATANAVYITLCLIGVGAILSTSIGLMVTLKVIGGLFLMYIAYHALKAPKNAYANFSTSTKTAREFSLSCFCKEFVTGFLSGILNPKNLLFYLSLFTVALTPEVSISFKVLLGVWMTLVVFFWDVAIIYMLSKTTIRQKFIRAAFYIDKVTGIVLGAIGFNILKSVWSKQP